MYIIHADLGKAGESETLFQLERWFSLLIRSPLTRVFIDAPCVTSIYDSDLLHQLKHKFFYKLLLKPLACFISIYHPDHRYSEHATALIHACKTANISLERPLFNNSGVSDYAGILTWEQGKVLIHAILDFINSDKFQRFKYDRLYQENRNLERLQAYAEQLHQKYSKLLVVRIDLGYQRKNGHLLKVADVYQHLNQLLKKKDSGVAQFKDVVGYAWAIEQGMDKNYHIHCVFYFNGHKRHRDKYIAYQIGLLWRHITANNGTFYNCNQQKKKYRYLGVGMIHRNDATAVENSINAICYLARPDKLDQYLRVRPGKNSKTFATGLCLKSSKPI